MGTGLMAGEGGMRECSNCCHIFFAHGPDGCRTCGCTAVRGGLFRPDTPPEEILRQLRFDPGTDEEAVPAD